jgi:hypothetical protein
VAQTDFGAGEWRRCRAWVARSWWPHESALDADEPWGRWVPHQPAAHETPFGQSLERWAQSRRRRDESSGPRKARRLKPESSMPRVVQKAKS